MPQNKKNAPAAGGSMKLFYGLLAAVAVVGIAAIVLARGGSGDMVTSAVDLDQIEGDATALIQQAQGVPAGENNAPVRVMVFSDYMCPGCGHWATNIEPFLKRDYVDAGKAQLVYYDFPLPNHQYSFIASRAARCAGEQGQFWPYHDRLFGSQSQWSYSGGVPVDLFNDYARDLGLDVSAFESCVRSEKFADVVSASMKLGQTLGVNSTPTVFINGRAMGPNEWGNYGAVQAAIEAAGGS